MSQIDSPEKQTTPPFETVADAQQTRILKDVFVSKLQSAETSSPMMVSRLDKDGKPIRVEMQYMREDLGNGLTYEAVIDITAVSSNETAHFGTFPVSVYRTQHTIGSNEPERDVMRFNVWQGTRFSKYGIGNGPHGSVVVQWIPGLDIRDDVPRRLNDYHGEASQGSNENVHTKLADFLKPFENHSPQNKRRARFLGKIARS